MENPIANIDATNHSGATDAGAHAPQLEEPLPSLQQVSTPAPVEPAVAPAPAPGPVTAPALAPAPAPVSTAHRSRTRPEGPRRVGIKKYKCSRCRYLGFWRSDVSAHIRRVKGHDSNIDVVQTIPAVPEPPTAPEIAGEAPVAAGVPLASNSSTTTSTEHE